MPAEPPSLGLLTCNIGNPSRERAERQLAWLAERPEDVLVLTETADSRGCAFLAERFTGAGYAVTYPAPPRGERGVMIVSRLALAGAPELDVGYLPFRAAMTAVKTDQGLLEVVGLYVPSRDSTPEKTARKRGFVEACQARLPHGTGAFRVVLGDLNILEPDHQPRYPVFRAFEYDFYRWFSEAGYVDAFRALHPVVSEYSWVGRTGDGYRYDHAFVSGALRARVDACAYVHEPRAGDGLTDHSALTLRLALAGADPLVLSDPAAAPDPTLF